MNKTLFWILVLFIAPLIFIDYHYFDEYMLNKHCYQYITILKSTTDNRHLTSVIYINLKGDTIARDYLTYIELRNLY